MTANYETTRELTNRFYDLILDSCCDAATFIVCCEHMLDETFYTACNDDQIRAAYIRAASKAAAEHAANYYETPAENRENMESYDYLSWAANEISKVDLIEIPRPIKPLEVNDIVGDGLKAEVIDVQQIADNRSVVICLLGPDNFSNFVVWTALHADGRWTVHSGSYCKSLFDAIDASKKRVAEQNEFLYG